MTSALAPPAAMLRVTKKLASVRAAITTTLAATAMPIRTEAARLGPVFTVPAVRRRQIAPVSTSMTRTQITLQVITKVEIRFSNVAAAGPAGSMADCQPEHPAQSSNTAAADRP